MENGVRINANLDVMYEACGNGHANIVNFLIQNGASVVYQTILNI